ncbi:S8 family peptidase [Faecalicatena contorta]|uniref:Subtilase family protein n=1 Tax=Faecalicatena contorta TaxID=39482 RepID=A0A315ZZV1_9FIRM|nr:S8 family peptidase [Faecalicatena contorta]PWJ50809.1 subtilase family protein [Faecalicatena contorta]SUQ13377.1 Subtilase family protein [Faecalicatena contorta]
MKKIIDENYYDFIVDSNSATLDNPDYFTRFTQRYSLLHTISGDVDMCDLGRQPYHRFPTLYTLSSQLSLDSSGIPQIQQNSALALFGFGVIVAVIDTGIDYRHPAFRYNDGTSRILSIWDQTIQEGTPPEGFEFGTEYGKEIIDIALQTEEPMSIVPTIDTNGHGTAIASIAAGSRDSERSFSGVAPQSEFVIVKLKEAKQNLRKIFCVPEDSICYQETDVIFGMRYVLEIATKLNRPLIVCIALSSSLGGHEALGAVSVYVDYLTQLSHIAVSVAAGNEGNKKRHYYGNVLSPPFVNEFELKVSKKDSCFSFELWTDFLARLTIQIVAPSGEKSPIVYPSIKDCNHYQFIFGKENVWINNILIEKENATQLILVRINNATEGIWRIHVGNIGKAPFSFDCWLPSGELISNETFFMLSDPNTTITCPGNTVPALTTTAYDQFSNSIIAEASRGYTRIGRVKPDVAAPGSRIPCAVPQDKYSILTGTGAAAAHAAGVIAMALEWAVVRGNYTSITGNDISSLIIQSADRNPTYVYPNNVWGYGSLNINAFFEFLTYIGK